MATTESWTHLMPA
uniref:Uncharacterized protein n=1 Tax=Arundo donax TaxID=35708 RepID=A0A0A9GMC7_ARUDO